MGRAREVSASVITHPTFGGGGEHCTKGTLIRHDFKINTGAYDK